MLRRSIQWKVCILYAIQSYRPLYYVLEIWTVFNRGTAKKPVWLKWGGVVPINTVTRWLLVPGRTITPELVRVTEKKLRGRGNEA